MTHYHRLSVARDATEEEIHAGFKQEAKLLHPDAGGTQEQFAELTEAYATLKDANKRKLYDQWMLTNLWECPKCEGSGGRFVQRGFQKVRMGNCAECSGVGYHDQKGMTK